MCTFFGERASGARYRSSCQVLQCSVFFSMSLGDGVRMDMNILKLLSYYLLVDELCCIEFVSSLFGSKVSLLFCLPFIPHPFEGCMACMEEERKADRLCISVCADEFLHPS